MSTRHQEISAKILNLLDRGLLLRHKWSQGEAMCLLAAASSEAAKHESADYCPLDLMPQWLAQLTPAMDDNGSQEAWEPMVRRYSDLFSRWHVLTPEAWERARCKSLEVILSEARSHVSSKETKVLEVLDFTLDWIRQGAPEAQRAEVQSKACAVRDAAAANAACAAANAACAAANAAVAACAVVAACAAAADAAAAAWAAHADADADNAAYTAAIKTSWDRMTSGIFNVIEAEIQQAA